MKVYDYRIVECFDFDETERYFVIQKYCLAQQEYVLFSPKRFRELIYAQMSVRMLRKYKEPIYHYVE